MYQWKDIVGKGFSAMEFRRYAETLNFEHWQPEFIVLHHTAEPNLAQWHSKSGEEWMLHWEGLYRYRKGWSAGPHLFIADDKIWVFTPLTCSGVHSPSWNSISWGVEIVGQYDQDSFCGNIRENTISALATLHALAHLNPNDMRLHKEDQKTTHKNCPGKNVIKEEVIEAVIEHLAMSRLYSS